MTQQTITPPSELVEQWRKSGPADAAVNNAYERHIATRAAQWGADQQLKLDAEQIEKAYQAGADQELEACYEWLRAKYWICPDFTDELRAARRPKPPSLKEQALEALDEEQAELSIQNYKLIRAVLESLPDHE